MSGHVGTMPRQCRDEYVRREMRICEFKSTVVQVQLWLHDDEDDYVSKYVCMCVCVCVSNRSTKCNLFLIYYVPYAHAY